MWAVELSGEHPGLARAEAGAVVGLCGGARVASLERVVFAEEGLDVGGVVGRVALARRVVRVVERCGVDLDAIVDAADGVGLGGRRFAVRCTRLDASVRGGFVGRVERAVGGALAGRGVVDLEDPEVVVRVLLDEEAVVGVDTGVVDRGSFEDRHVEARPFFSPVSLHPRLARAWVNLARVGEDVRMWDPFVGTGGIALEAGLVGGEVVVSDLSGEMLEGAGATLEHFGVEASFVEGDVEEVASGLGRASVGAVVADPPYGRASATGEEGVGGLFERFLGAAGRVLEPGGWLVCGAPEAGLAKHAPSSLSLVDRFAWYVHASLTRNVFVFQKREER